MDWQSDAACLGSGHDRFFGDDPKLPMKRAEVEAAKAICHACPVRSDCLEYALVANERWGVWGGLTAPERDRLQRRAAR